MALSKATLNQTVMDITARTDKSSMINTTLDLALKTIFRKHCFRELYDTNTGTTSSGLLTLPSDFRTLVEARFKTGSDSYSLKYKNKLWLMKNYPDIADETSEPEFCYVSGSTLTLVPLPDTDDIIRITYKKKPSFSLDIDHLEDVIIYFSVAFVFRSIGMPDVAQYWDAQYVQYLMEAIEEDKKKNEFWQADEFNVSTDTNDVFFVVPDSLET
jgi:hypothetical protein